MTRRHRADHGCGAYTFEDGPGLIALAATHRATRVLELGAALGSRMLVGKKVRLRTGAGHNEVGLGRSHSMRSVDTSLLRLGRDHIDLYQLHDRDALVPVQEAIRALDDLATQ
jgi:aryl-alcohol dehydrogenase-like predicted oxidoreductase